MLHAVSGDQGLQLLLPRPLPFSVLLVVTMTVRAVAVMAMMAMVAMVAVCDSLEAGQRRLLLVGQLRVGQLATQLRRYLLAVGQLVDVQRADQVELAVTELALIAGGQRSVAVPWDPSAEAHLEVVVVGATVGAQQRADMEPGPALAALVAGHTTQGSERAHRGQQISSICVSVPSLLLIPVAQLGIRSDSTALGRQQGSQLGLGGKVAGSEPVPAG